MSYPILIKVHRHVHPQPPSLPGLLLNVPLSLALPAVARHDHYHSSYEGRRLPPPFPDGITTHRYSSPEDDNVLYDDPHYLTETTKLTSYFAYLQVRFMWQLGSINVKSVFGHVRCLAHR